MQTNATQRNATPPVYSSLVAVGDSFTEGMSDLLPDGSYRGWADLLADRMAARTPGFRYANLAVRGKLIGQIVAEQVDVAAAMEADVITLVGGLNDALRPTCDMGRVRGLLEEAVERLAPACKQLVLMRSPGRQGPVLERFRPRMEELFTCVDELAARHGALVVDLYGARPPWATPACGTWTGCTSPPRDTAGSPRRCGRSSDTRRRTRSGVRRCRRQRRPDGPRVRWPTHGSPGSTCCRGSAAA